MAKKDCQINIRLTKADLAYIKRQAKKHNTTDSGWILGCIYGEKELKYIQVSEPVEFDKLKPPPGPPKVRTLIDVNITQIQPRGTVNKASFLTEIRDVFKEKGIFIN